MANVFLDWINKALLGGTSGETTTTDTSRDELIVVHPGLDPRGRMCVAEPWGRDGHTVCPFLRDGVCRFWEFNTRLEPELAKACPLHEILVPIDLDA